MKYPLSLIQTFTHKSIPMKKSKLQVMIEFASVLNQIKASKKSASKFVKGARKKMNVALTIFIFTVLTISSAQATVYYSRTSGGNWNVNTTWSTVAYGNATNTGTFPIAGDVANIGNGYTIYINTAVNCARWATQGTLRKNSSIPKRQIVNTDRNTGQQRGRHYLSKQKA